MKRFSTITGLVLLWLAIFGTADIAESQEPVESTGMVLVDRLARFDENPTVGPYFRIRLVLSPQFRSMLGDAKTQVHVSIAIMERIGVRNKELAKLVKDVNHGTSEAEASRIFNAVSERYKKILTDAESELKALITPSEYEKIVRVQLGLLGPLGFSDEVARDICSLSKEQYELMRPALTKLRSLGPLPDPAAEAYKDAVRLLQNAEKDVLKPLNPSQLEKFKVAMDDARKFREKESERIESFRDELSLEQIGNEPPPETGAK